VAPAGRDPGGDGARILIVDDAEAIRTYLADLFELRGYQVDTAEDGRSALALLEGGAAPDLVLLDVMMPGIDGVETLRRIRSEHPQLPVVMLSVVGKATTIVEAMRAGAADYLNKPFEEEELEAILVKVLSQSALRAERERLLDQTADGFRGALWESPALQHIRNVIAQVAETDVTILIGGESGTGKEIVARTLHDDSSRSAGPFVKVNCAALPEPLLESELFGYERGAFTGAASRKLGKFEIADGGTIFLDEIGEMSPALQAKLLQVLQDATFSRLGGNEEIRVDSRVVCATHRRLEEMVAEGAFREDLFYRLNVVNIQIPPLRERRDEIAPLLRRFLERYRLKYQRPGYEVSARLREALQRHSFPGNVRELENLAKRLVVLGSEESVLRQLYGGSSAKDEAHRLSAVIDDLEASAGQHALRDVGRRAALEAERQVIRWTLQRTRWNRKEAARLLGVSYKTLLQKIRECDLRASQ
jgi:DNA-binding NtrC family response regulator